MEAELGGHIVAEAEKGREGEAGRKAGSRGGVKTCLINGFGFLKEGRKGRERRQMIRIVHACLDAWQREKKAKLPARWAGKAKLGLSTSTTNAARVRVNILRSSGFWAWRKKEGETGKLVFLALRSIGGGGGEGAGGISSPPLCMGGARLCESLDA